VQSAHRQAPTLRDPRRTCLPNFNDNGVMAVLHWQTGDCRNPSELIPFVPPDPILGMIFSFSGPIVDIPGGYSICDGTNGTPDLRDKFVVGANSTYAVDAVGGNATHPHAFTGNGHKHFCADPGTDLSDTGGVQHSTPYDSIVGTTDAGTSLAPYYALAYIMRSS